MDHPRFVEGAMTTAFIAEEYPEGFRGVALPGPTLRRIAAAAAAMHRVAEIRRARISGRMDNHERKVGAEWVVSLQGEAFPVTIDADRTGASVTFADGARMRVVSDWTPGQPLARLEVDGELLVLKVGRITSGYRVRVRGADLRVDGADAAHGRAGGADAGEGAARHLAAAALPDAGADGAHRRRRGRRGVRRSGALHGRGDEDGERAAGPSAGRGWRKVRAKPGDSLAVDDVIMEFE